MIPINDRYITKRDGSKITLRYVVRNQHISTTTIYLDGLQIYHGNDNDILLDVGMDTVILNKRIDIYSDILKFSTKEIQCDLYMFGGTISRHWRETSNNNRDNFEAHILIR